MVGVNISGCFASAGAGTSGQTVDSVWKGAYKAGGIALVIAGFLGLLVLIPGLALGTLPTTGEGYLTWAGETSTFGAFFALSAASDFFYIPAVLGLYLALKDVRKTGMLFAVAVWGFAIALDLSRLFVSYSVSSLSSGYAAATSQAQQAAYVAASDVVFGTSYGASFVAISVIFYVAILIISWVMLKSVFGKGIAYLGIVTSIVGLVGSPYSPALFPNGVLFVPFLIGGVLSSIWSVLAGYKLYKLG